LEVALAREAVDDGPGFPCAPGEPTIDLGLEPFLETRQGAPAGDAVAEGDAFGLEVLDQPVAAFEGAFDGDGDADGRARRAEAILFAPIRFERGIVGGGGE
jgi:hypothetical protein